MHKDKRKAEAEAKGDLDHRIIVAGPETRARENDNGDTRPEKTVVSKKDEAERPIGR